ncbi:TPA: hypothetical protein MYP09_001413 [Citrobacter farmeri]|nr:hypothetical protein [Citrobacter farmeri]
MKLKIIPLLIISCFALTACNEDKKKEESASSGFSFSPVATKETPKTEQATQPQPPIEAPQKAPEAQPGATPGSTPTNAATGSGNSRKDRDRSTTSALAEFNKGEFFHSLVMTSEGYVSHPYRDNLGWALGYGWNITMNGQSANRTYAAKAGLDKPTTEKIAVMGIAKGGKPNLEANPQPGIAITQPQALSVVDQMRKPCEEAAINWIGSDAWKKLKPNQQAVLIDHFYRLGIGGAKQFTTMQKAVKTYAANPTEENSQKVAQTFVYKYRIKIGDAWQVKQDKRATTLLGSLWMNSEAFSSMLSNKPISASASQTLQKVASFSNIKIDTTKPLAQQIDEQDELDKLIDQMEAQGQKVEVQPMVNDKPITPVFEEAKVEEKPKAKAPANNGCVKVNAQVWKCPPGVIPPELQ